MEQTVVSTEYAVGLSREEYIYSQTLAAKALRGKYLLGSRVFSVIMMVLCVLAVLFDRKLSGRWDMSLLVIVVLMIGVEIWMFLTTPRHLRRQHGLVYDKTSFHGYSFDGVITVDDRSIAKRNNDSNTVIPFTACTAFIEDAEMLLFCVNGGKSIVIPKRFLTMEDAELTRQAALRAIAPSRCYLFGRVDAVLSEKLPLPDEGVPVPEDPLMQIAIQYTPKELKSQITEMTMLAYIQKLPQKTLTAVLVTILAYFGFSISPIPSFLLCAVLLFVFSVVGARMRVSRMVAISGGDAGSTRIEMTETAVKIKGKNSDMLTVPWQCVTRAVETPREVEFFVNGEKAFVIPKRCVEDMAELRRIVDTHMSV